MCIRIWHLLIHCVFLIFFFFRKIIESQDHGIFTPFISRGKRLSSESSSSEKENEYNEENTRTKVQKIEQNIHKFNKTELDSICISSDESCDELSDYKIKKKFPAVSISRPTTTEILKKDLSWCFSDKDSSIESEEEFKSDGKTSSSKKTSSSEENSVKSNLKTPSKEKSLNILPTKSPITPTPITFRLKHVNKLTPKNESESKLKRPMSFLSSLSSK